LLLAGCSVLPETQPDHTRFYVLTSPAAKGDAATVAGAEQPARVVLKSVVVPEFLRGKIMPVRVADNELRFVDEARWAEPLEPALTRVVREGLASRAAVRVVAHGGDEHDFDVAIRLRDCEGVLPTGAARLAAHIEIFSVELDPKLVAQDDFTTDVTGWDGKDYGALAKKLSEAADELAGRIAALVPVRNK
jgi:uncharacterized lipoprotein YmbA